MSIIIRSIGVFFIMPKNTLKSRGYIREKLPERLFEAIWFRFANSKIEDLKSRYMASHTDDEEVEVSFVKDNKVIKSIYDYGHASPHVFVSAYTYLMNRIDNLTDLQKSSQALFQSVSFNYYLTHSKIGHSLLRSESFWLWSKLLKAKIIKKLPAQSKLNYILEKNKDWVEIIDKNGNIQNRPLEYYTLILSDGNQYKVKNKTLSDGRFFKIETLEGKTLLLDIGINIFTAKIVNRPLEYPYIPL
ncbi:MAG: hypothetical protein R2822_29200 [Spirosomataceae bacterium]